MHVLLELLKTIGFFICQLGWKVTQNLKWRLDSTILHIKNASRKEHYHQSAHVLDILFKHCMDPVCLPNSTKYFILVSKMFTHPRHVLRAEVSLYCMNETEAVFIEAPLGVEVWRNRYGAFHKQAQYHYGKRIIRMPLDSFHRLCEDLEDPGESLIFNFIIPRSGSALMCKIFEETGRAVTYAEPHIFTQPFHHFKPTHSESIFKDSETAKLYLKPIARYLCRSNVCRNDSLCLIKVAMDFARDLAPLLRTSFPQAKFLFQYRNGAPLVASMDRSFAHLPVHRALLFLKSFPWICTKLLLSEARYCNQYHYDKLIHDAIVQSKCPKHIMRRFQWASNLRDYLDLHQSGFPISAIKYEDLVEHPQESLRAIFVHCGIPQDLIARACHAFAEDAHANSPMSRARTASTDTSSISSNKELQEDVDRLIHLLNVPSLHQDVRAPNTITC